MSKRDPDEVAREIGLDGLKTETLTQIMAAETGEAEAHFHGRVFSIQDFLECDMTNDVNAYLGRRWLCRGGSCLWIGSSGIGKSAMLMQASLVWALGMDFFGIRPSRPLKSVIIQGENDKGDLAEALQGVVKGLDIGHRVGELNNNVLFITESAKTGEDFVRTMELAIDRFQPDQIWLDPIMSFVGDDISDQKVCSHFFRNLINPVLQRTGVVFHAMHHPPKPKIDQGKTTSDMELLYSAFGSSDLTNWARAIMVLRPLKDGDYELRSVKRLKRHGMTDGFGERADAILLKHAEGRICWERAQEDKAAPPDDGPAARRAALCTALSENRWLPVKLVEAAWKDVRKISTNQAHTEILEILSDNGLLELRTEDGERDCGLFLAKKEKNQLLMRLKPTGGKNDAE